MQNHPLFPPKDDEEDSPDVHFIHVSRFEAGGKPFAPHRFNAEDLTDLAQIYDMFGGGKYELVGRNERTVIARRTYELAGKSKPLTGETESNTAAQPVHQAQPQAFPQSELLAVMQMMQSSNQAMLTMVMTMMQESSKQSTALVTAMLSRDSEASKTLLQALSSSSERTIQSQAQVYQTMLEAVAGKGNGKDLLNAYREGLGDAGGADDEKPEGDDLMSTVGSVVEGLKIASSLAGGGVTPVEGAAP